MTIIIYNFIIVLGNIMELKIKDLVELFQLSEKTIYRWIKEKKIPAYKINHQYRFSKSEINEWILNNKIIVSNKIIDLQTSIQPVNLIQLLNRGGIFYNIEGNSIEEIIENTINIIPTPLNIKKKNIIEALLEREKLMSTSIGNGIAIPHPRNPIITDNENSSISICFLKNQINFNAIDDIPVHTIFIIISANPKRHLETLAKISYLCQQEDFRVMLKNHTPKNDIHKYIEKIELQWEKREDK